MSLTITCLFLQSFTDTFEERWLATYTEANPARSQYSFCIAPKHAGFFWLCFKPGQDAPVQEWNVKVVPGAYELQKNLYPDMRALCNGFKTIMVNLQHKRARAGR